jgi:FdhE protein
MNMHQADEASMRIERIIARAAEKNPQAQGILAAFKPILTEKTCLLATLELPAVDCRPIDKERLSGGVPVLSQCDLFAVGDQAAAAALSLIAAIRNGMPQLVSELDGLEKEIKSDGTKLVGALRTYFRQPRETVEREAEAYRTAPAVIHIVLKYTTAVILQKRAEEIAALLNEFTWDKGYCPICGSLPAMAVIRDKEGQRCLHCSACAYEWRFSRVICPFCEKEAPDGMDFFFIDDRKQEAAFTCDSCKKYLITLNRSDNLNDYDVEVAALTLIHLDMIMQDKGFQPMTDMIWNAVS